MREAKLSGNAEEQANAMTEILTSQSDIIEKGEGLYNRYKSITTHSFLNPNKLIGDNPYVIEQKINEDFQFYSDSINAIIARMHRQELFSKFGMFIRRMRPIYGILGRRERPPTQEQGSINIVIRVSKKYLYK